VLCCRVLKENEFWKKIAGENEGPQGPISFQTQAKLKKTKYSVSKKRLKDMHKFGWLYLYTYRLIFLQRNGKTLLSSE